MDRKARPLVIRGGDLIMVAIVIAVIELNVAVGGGDGAAPAYVLGAVIVAPLLAHERWPRAVHPRRGARRGGARPPGARRGDRAAARACR